MAKRKKGWIRPHIILDKTDELNDKSWLEGLPKKITKRKLKKNKGAPARNIYGQRSKCTPELIEKARKLAAIGCPRYMLAMALGIGRDTLIAWAKEKPPFLEAINQGHAEYTANLLKVKNDILTGEADPMKYPEVRRKVIDSSIDRFFPEFAKQDTIILSPKEAEEKPQTKAMKAFEFLQEMLDNHKPKSLTSENKPTTN